MPASFHELASNPRQYDLGQVVWADEGSKQHFTRRMILEAILPSLGEIDGKKVLDVGCGQGWLCDELSERGADCLGIEPSLRNVESARQQFPALEFRHTSLQDFMSDERFGLITANMVFEHLGDLNQAFSKIASLLQDTGRLVILHGDFERFTTPRFGYGIELQVIEDGETATRTDYGERAGVLYDIFRTPERMINAAANNGLVNIAHHPFPVPDWAVQEQPHYAAFQGKPIFQILSFELEH